MKIPSFVQEIGKKLRENNFEAYLVGGCVRDLLLKKEPQDWDITTNARPEEIQKIFPESVYENDFGTVGVKIKENGETKCLVEITTYRLESKYSDKRHPDEVKFTDKLENDLKRRDFTINALAFSLGDEQKIIDLFQGEQDLKKKIIRAVGDPHQRFNEDGLRIMRAIRFSVQLGFNIEENTFLALQKNASILKNIAGERIRIELIKILASPNPAKGIEWLQKIGALKIIMPELEKCRFVQQNRHHIYDVYQHLLYSLQYCPSADYLVRLAALLHDIGKPQTKKGDGPEATFYNHEVVSAKIAAKIMKRLAFSKKEQEKVVNLIKNHMFYYNVGEVTEAGVRRLLRKVGPENIKDLIDLRIADRLGSGVPKAKPYKLRHLEYLIEKVKNDPISVKMLKINGNDLIQELKIKPGPKIGAILDCLLAEVIENPALNKKSLLLKRAKELNKLDLAKLRQQAKEKIEEKQKKEEEKIKKKHWVK